MATYRVDSHHLNIGRGDAALHILLRQRENDEATVDSVVLVDGGLGNRGPTIIREFLNSSEFGDHYYYYQQDNNTNQKLPVTRFNAIVVTHWDSDHAAGLYNLIQEDLQAQGVQFVRTNGIETNNDFKAQVDDGKLWSSLCHYKDWLPTTVLYSPYWDPSQSQCRPKPHKTHVRELSLKTARNQDFVTFAVSFACEPKPGHGVVQYSADVPALKLGRHGRDLIGMDLFTDSVVLTADQAVAPVAVRQAMMHLEDRGERPYRQPGMICVGSDGLVGNENPSISMGLETEKRNLSTNSIYKTEKDGNNAASVACMIVWPNRNEMRVSHYFAGDAPDLVENKIMEWANSLHISAIKLSHHGSKFSTPSNMLDAFRPNAIFASNGMHGGYNHCSWETLFLIMACIDRSSIRHHVLYSTNMPIFMIKAFMTDAPNTMSPGAIDALNTPKGQAWRDRVLNMVNSYLPNHATQNETQLKKAIIDMISKNWDVFSAIPMAEYHGPTGSFDSTMKEASSQMVRVAYLIQYQDESSDIHRYMTGASVGDISWWEYDLSLGTDYLSPRYLPRLKMTEVAKLNDKTRANLGSAKRQRRPFGMITSATVFDCLNSVPESDQSIKCAQLDRTSSGDIFDAIRCDSLQSSPFYLISEDSTVAAGVESKKAVVGTNLDIFLAHLYTGAFVLSSAPASIPAPIAHDRSDEMLHWLMGSLGDVEDDKSCSLFSIANLNAGDGTVDISRLEFRTKLIYACPVGTKLSDSEFFRKEVLFSSDNNEHDFDIKDATIKWPGAPQGKVVDVFGPAQVFCCSLGQTPFGAGASPKVSGNDILNMLGFEAKGPVSWLSSLSDFTLDTSRGSRNSLWVVPGEKFESTLRLCFKPAESSPNNDTLGLIVDLIKKAVGIKESPISVSKARIITKQHWSRTGGYQSKMDDTKVQIDTELTILTEVTITAGNVTLPLESAITIAPRSFRWILNFGPKENGTTIDNLYKFIVALFGTQDPPKLTEYLPKANQIALRRISFLSRQSKGEPSGRKSVSLTMQVTFAQTTLLCSLKAQFGGLTKPKFAFYGNLFSDTRPEKRGSIFSFTPFMPNAEPWILLEVCPVKNEKGQMENVDGSDVGNLGSIYKTAAEASLQTTPFDPTLVGLQFALMKDQIWFSANVMCTPPKGQADVPVLRLEAASLELRYDIAKPKSSSIMLATSTVMASPRATDVAIWNLDLRYDGLKSEWELSGGVTGLRGYLIYSLFDDNCNVEMEQLLKNIILDLSLSYLYNSQGLGSTFTAAGILHLGDLQLACRYVHNGGKDAPEKPRWTFSASLSAGQQKSTLLDILSSICGDGLKDLLPECVKNVKVEPPDNDASLTSLKVIKTEGAFLTLIRLQVTKSISLAFYQIQEKRSNLKSEVASPVKRVLVMSLATLPTVPDIPLIGPLPQPFDEMRFLWVSSSDKAVQGLTRKDIELINGAIDKEVASGEPGSEYLRLSYKDTKREQKQEDVLLTSAFHFCLLQSGDTKLDYAFGGGKDKGTTNGSANEQEDVVSSTAATTPMNKTVGPVKINGVGIEFDMATERLTLIIDGTLMLGPVEMSLIGFSVSFNLKQVTLLNFGELKPSFDLSGLAVSFQKAPLTIAGAFAHVKSKNSDMFMGGAIVGFQPWIFEAGGYYGTTKKGSSMKAIKNESKSGEINQLRAKTIVLTDEEFKSFLAYVKLSGPIATIGYAEIRGLVGGFGYNTSVRFPTMYNIMQFPFLTPPGGKSPSEALTNMLNGGWFSNKEGSKWVAAGLTVLAFELLTVSAVLVVEWGSGVQLGVFGLATAEVPKQLEQKFARVQLGLSCTIDFDAGVLKVDGQLTPASFILDPSCHLTGGFALYSWFGDKNGGKQGDFVFTIGGYHAAYTVPPLHPNPPRLGISWSYSSSINITGGSYFAITPTACMGGGSLRVTLTLGPLYAYLMAYADFLINYRPFTYQASAGIVVGVKYTLDLWLVSIPINISLGATVYFKGPPLSGKVRVNFYVFGFDVNFGDQSPILPKAIGLDEFYQLVLQTDSKQGAANAHAIWSSEEKSDDTESISAVETQPHVITCISGLVPPDEKKQNNEKDAKWIVRGPVFAFQVMCKFAVADAKVVTETGGSNEKFEHRIDHDATKAIFSKPMQIQQELAQSSLVITIAPKSTPGMLELDPKTNPTWDKATAGYSNLPNGLWSRYNASLDPSDSRNDPTKIINAATPGTTRHLTSVTLYAPNATRSADCIAPFNVEKSMGSVAACHVFPTVTAANSAWAAAPQAPDPMKQFQDVRDTWSAKKDMATQVAKFVADLALGGWEWEKAKKGKITAPERLMKKLDKWCIETPSVSVA
ncbi:MAG: hypothetical protein Q9191_004007 [Dirinaria sp. TL-2023a]